MFKKSAYSIYDLLSSAREYIETYEVSEVFSIIGIEEFSLMKSHWGVIFFLKIRIKKLDTDVLFLYMQTHEFHFTALGDIALRKLHTWTIIPSID